MVDYKILLDRFNEIPTLDVPPPTFMEIAGYPHYENVCSNILAFFFDTSQQHNYKDLFFKSLLICVQEQTGDEELETVSVEREVPTTSNKRIDIVIRSNDLVIAIENKIWADLYNDLLDYSNFVEKEYKNEKRRIKVILSLYAVDKTKLNHGFINITHQELLSEVMKRLGSQLTRTHNKYLFQLIDFIETIQNHTKQQTMNKEMIDFFKKEKATINKLLEENNKISNYIASKVKELQSLVNPKYTNARQWIYRKYDLVHDFTMSENIIVAVDCYLTIDGIGIHVWVRHGDIDKVAYLKSLPIYTEDIPFNKENRLIIQSEKEMDLLTETRLVAEKLSFVLERISISIR